MLKDTERAKAARDASALLELAMGESATPVDDLGEALARMSRVLLSGCRKLVDVESGSALDEVTRVQLQQLRALLLSDVSVCIESLQFHDRMLQQLAHARKCLADAGLHHPIQPPQRPVDAWITRHAGEGSIELF